MAEGTMSPYDLIRQLMILRQSSSVRAYIDQFNEIRTRVNLTEPFTIGCFITGLRPDIADRVRQPYPASLQQAFTLALLADISINLEQMATICSRSLQTFRTHEVDSSVATYFEHNDGYEILNDAIKAEATPEKLDDVERKIAATSEQVESVGSIVPKKMEDDEQLHLTEATLETEHGICLVSPPTYHLGLVSHQFFDPFFISVSRRVQILVPRFGFLRVYCPLAANLLHCFLKFGEINDAFQSIVIMPHRNFWGKVRVYDEARAISDLVDKNIGVKPTVSQYVLDSTGVDDATLCIEDRLRSLGLLSSSAFVTFNRTFDSTLRAERTRCMKNGIDHGSVMGEIRIPSKAGDYGADSFGFEPGPYFALNAFQQYATDFKAHYFRQIGFVADARVSVTKENIAENMRDLRRAFLDTDVSLPVVRRFVQAVSREAVHTDMIHGVRPNQQLVKIFSDEFVKLMGGEVSYTCVTLENLRVLGTGFGALLFWCDSGGWLPAVNMVSASTCGDAMIGVTVPQRGSFVILLNCGVCRLIPESLVHVLGTGRLWVISTLRETAEAIPKVWKKRLKERGNVKSLEVISDCWFVAWLNFRASFVDFEQLPCRRCDGAFWRLGTLDPRVQHLLVQVGLYGV